MEQITIPKPADLEGRIVQFENENLEIPGISSPHSREAFILQLIDSIRDIEFCGVLSRKDYAESFSDPHARNFNPLKGARYFHSNDELDEAVWLIFITIWFGKAKPGSWNLIRAFYSGINTNYIWTWENVTNHLDEFHSWLDGEMNNIKAHGKFGNHRKYETLKNFGRSVETYLEWVGSHYSHQLQLLHAIEEVGDTPSDLFDYLYETIGSVFRFGRMARFDFLCMLGKLNLYPIEPGSPYFKGATCPLKGAKDLFGANISNSRLEELTIELGRFLGYPFAMQIMEDAICNWQKSPNLYKRFTG